MTELKMKIDELESAKELFIQELNSWSVEDQNFCEDGEWNALKVVEHIIVSEVGTLAYMQKKTKVKASEIPFTNSNHQLNSESLNRSLKSNDKWIAPEVLPDPKGESSFEAQSAFWHSFRLKLNAFLNDLDEEYYGKQVFRHPYAGRINLFQTLDFLTTHIDHHMHQLQRIKQAIKK